MVTPFGWQVHQDVTGLHLAQQAAADEGIIDAQTLRAQNPTAGSEQTAGEGCWLGGPVGMRFCCLRGLRGAPGGGGREGEGRSYWEQSVNHTHPRTACVHDRSQQQCWRCRRGWVPASCCPTCARNIQQQQRVPPDSCCCQPSSLQDNVWGLPQLRCCHSQHTAWQPGTHHIECA